MAMRTLSYRAMVAVFVVAAMSVGTFINGLFPTREEVLGAPFMYEDAAPRLGSAAITELRSYSEYRDVETNGIFLEFTLDVNAEDDQVALMGVLTDGAGREVTADSSLGHCMVSQPGIPAPCTIVVEVDRTALAGSTLTLYGSFSRYGVPAIVVDPEITHDDAERLLTDARRMDSLIDQAGEEL